MVDDRCIYICFAFNYLSLNITFMKHTFIALFLVAAFFGAKAQRAEADKIGSITIQPVMHASLVLTENKTTIYVDPSGDPSLFRGLPAPGIILVTDIHGDHFDVKAIEALRSPTTILVMPQACADKLPGNDKTNLVIVKNGDVTTKNGVEIKAIPMYNLPESPTAMHTKGRGNGYVLTMGGKHIYISGDTQGIPEMRALTGIDVAFVCMNLPYTMDVKEAADATLAFKPKIVYPYHYRGQNGLSDVNEFKKLVNAGDKNIDVRLKNWYPAK